MHCTDFRSEWSEWRDGGLEDEAARAMAAHRAECPACRRYDHQMRAMLSGLAALPLPGSAAPAEWPERAVGWRGLALAAALVLAFGGGVLVQQSLDSGRPGQAVDTVVLAPGDTREVHLAFSTPRALEPVEFTVELPAGVELAGRPGERVVRWQGRLAEGRNRLRLPLEMTAGSSGGELVARIRHGGGTREWHVALEPAAAGTS